MRIKTRRPGEGIILRRHTLLYGLKYCTRRSFARKQRNGKHSRRECSKGSRNDFDRWRNRFRNHYPVNTRAFPRRRIFRRISFPQQRLYGNRNARSFILSLEYRNDSRIAIHGVFATISCILQQRSWSRRRNTWRIKRRENTRRRERDCKENVVEGVLNATVISDWSLDTYSTFRAGYTVRVSVLRVHFQFTKEFDGVWLQEGKRERDNGGDKKAVERKVESRGVAIGHESFGAISQK